MAVQTLGGQVGSGGASCLTPASGVGVVGATQRSAQPQVPLVRFQQVATSPVAHFGRALSGHWSHGVLVRASPVPIRASRSAQPNRASTATGARVRRILLVWNVMAG